MTPRLSGIRIFPVKSLDAVDVHESPVVGGGGLRHDREFRLTDSQGRVLNGKLLGEKLLRLRSEFDFAFGDLTVRDGDSTLRTRLPWRMAEAEAWFSEQLGAEVSMEQDDAGGFPDDLAASGPTLVSRATLEEVGGWFGLALDETRRRFRANLEIDGVPAFWEDRLLGETEPHRFRIGSVEFEGVNSSARCTVPTRDSRTGRLTPPGFAKLFTERRRATLPKWAPAARFDHYYRLTVNTRIPDSENGKVLNIGDEIHP